MPNWATRLTTVGQLLTVLTAIGAITLLAIRHVIDGATAVTGLMLVTGASALVPAAVHAGTKTSTNDTPPGRD